ncbi:hybrid sensor histidine kinase/response regulator [Roseimicrobium sp. ORNL1]|uniref:response regulator n=1 Tax=Roseimicrobium sp. ORNL1 TaxID=2711231 RepID=UPI0013E1562F|nr:hybrid sensor histidine kinase/response regulator [Roseimicrobium sp. ORNL1]QIF01570.1 response regulator [Roseimicrobium sp. ORNL1]
MTTTLASPSKDSPVSSASPAPQVANNGERGMFLSRAGHEMRNPLSNILALVEGIQDGIYGDIGLRQSEALGTIADNAQRLLTLINGFLDVEKIHAGTLALQNASFELDEISAQAARQLRGPAEARSLALRHSTSPQNITGEGDGKRILQIMTEALGCVVATVPAKGKVNLDVSTDLPGQVLLIRAWGGPSELQSTTVEKAVSSPPVMERLRKLKGIGISLINSLLALHDGGELDACELPGGGLLVKVRLPLKCSPSTTSSHEPAVLESVIADTEETSSPAGGEIDTHHSESPLILLVDDEDVLRNITHDYLESVGFRVMAATNGKEALELASQETPDLVIMDMLMPIMDGMEALQKIRTHSNPALSQVPIIAMSGLAVPAERDKCMIAGADACLVKPFGIKQLEMAMNQFLNSRHTNADA